MIEDLAFEVLVLDSMPRIPLKKEEEHETLSIRFIVLCSFLKGLGRLLLLLFSLLSRLCLHLCCRPLAFLNLFLRRTLLDVRGTEGVRVSFCEASISLINDSTEEGGGCAKATIGRAAFGKTCS